MDEYQYDYEEIDDLYQTQTNQEYESKQYKNYDQLLDAILKYMKLQSERLYIDDHDQIDNCLNVMINFQWSDELLNQSGFFEKHYVKNQLTQQGIINTYKITNKFGQCQLCFSETQLYQIGCYHYFCIDCYQQYVINKLKNNTTPLVPCLQYKCKYKLPFQIIQLLNNDAKKYFKISLCKSFLQNNVKYVFCLGEECEIIHSQYVGNQIDCSNCYTSICIICKELNHQPLSCDLASRWLNKNNSEDKQRSLIKLQYQTCYNCKEAVEKSEGCNHIKCRCGAHFCYICGQKWGGHSNFYACEQEADKQYKQQKKQYLKYLALYDSHQEKIVKQSQFNRQLIKKAQEINDSSRAIKININNIKQLTESIILQYQTLKYAKLYQYYFLIDNPNKSKPFKKHYLDYESTSFKFTDHLDTLGQFLQYFHTHQEQNDLITNICQICQLVDCFPTLFQQGQDNRIVFLQNFNSE